MVDCRVTVFLQPHKKKKVPYSLFQVPKSQQPTVGCSRIFVKKSKTFRYVEWKKKTTTVYLAGTTNTTQPNKIIIRYNTRWRDDGVEKRWRGFDRIPSF